MKTFFLNLRVRFFLLMAFISGFFERQLERILDRTNGDVSSVLSGFVKLEAKLERARMSAIREANRFDDLITKYENLADAAEAQYNSRIEAAEHAARVQKRFGDLVR